MHWLEKIIPFAEDCHHGYMVLENLARFSDKEPFLANKLWNLLLKRSMIDYPEEAIRAMLENLVRSGKDGVLAAKETVSIYLRDNNDSPWGWLNDIQDALD